LRKILAIVLFFCVLLPLDISAVRAADSGEEGFRIGHEPRKRGNILDLIFDTAPPLPTERGTIIIYAFHDENGNNMRDPGERELTGKIRCTLNEITYQVPAFIPGLNLNDSHELECEGDDYLPLLMDSMLFIEHRGQIIRIDLPCQKLH
jgi:hypothetical protein